VGLSEQSLELRKGRIGASEVAVLLDCGSPWKTKADLYARLVHGIEQRSKTIMWIGQRVEGFIFDLGRDTLDTWARRNSRSIVRDRYGATADGYCGCGGVIEVKNVGSFSREWWADDQVPPHYIAQVQLQMLASGRDHAHVWALLGGNDFQTRLVKADRDYQADMLERIDRFYDEHVDPRIPPDDTPDVLWLTFVKPEQTVLAQGPLKMLGDALALTSRDKRRALDEYEAGRDALAAAMARADVRELIDTAWTAKAGPVKNEPERWNVTFRVKEHR